jgi:hypothetical protein
LTIGIVSLVKEIISLVNETTIFSII